MIVLVPWDERVMVKLVGDAERVKLPVTGAVTVSETEVVLVKPPPVPVTVIVYVPVAVVEATAIVIVEVPAPGAAIDVGLKVTVTPVGWPLADNATAELKPPETELVIVEVPLLPCTTETEPGEADRLKLGLDELPASALIRPEPFGLPRPVAKSYPVVAEKPLLPLVMSWKSVP